jgi:hypothetical protein
MRERMAAIAALVPTRLSPESDKLTGVVDRSRNKI